MFINNLRREVLASVINGGKLGGDLHKLAKVYATDASEAVVFYCSRIVEAILKDIHAEFFGVRSAGRLVEIEKLLFDYNLLPQNKYYWAKGLRLIGNEARHSFRAINKEKADCALIFLEFIIKWYFCSIPKRQRLETIYHSRDHQKQLSPSSSYMIALTLDDAWSDLNRIENVVMGRDPEYLLSIPKNPTIPLLLMEIFISNGNHGLATRIGEQLSPTIHKASGAYKTRLLQLKALMLSREGRFDEALQILEPIYNKQIIEHPEWLDDETLGILAGVYKRLSNHHNSRDFLRKSHEMYLWGWRRNGNTYLGINSAATALWLDEADAACRIADEVKQILAARRKFIQQKAGFLFDLNYWDLVTLAEAELLTGNTKRAMALYDEAFLRDGEQTEHVAVTKKQCSAIQEKLSSLRK